jgi:NAD+ diphosphatase
MSFVPGIVPPPSDSPDLSGNSRVFFLVHESGLVLRKTEGGVSLPGEADLASLGLSAGPEKADDKTEPAHYLGQLGQAQAFVLPLYALPGAGFTVRNLRGLFGVLDDDTFAAAGRAVQIATWATTHRFCGRCATPTRREPEERAMRCPKCGLVAYPRISPAIIVLVRRGEEALLARGARFPLPFYSTLAGFAEVGESLEETLVREVREEVGIHVGNIRYFGSQPWPFPHSLMVGFFADYASGDIRVDGKEILDARWFRADGLPDIPPRLSIARRLIDTWVAEVRPARTL